MSQKEDWTREEVKRKYIDAMTAVTIPVNIQIKGQQRILDITGTKKILKDAELIAVGQCGCRTRLKKCDSPVDVCIALDKLAEDKIERELAAKASPEQAFEALECSHKAGLVHMAYTYKGNEKPDYVCSCCSCCCHSCMHAFVAGLTGPPIGTFILFIVPAIIMFVVAIYLITKKKETNHHK